MSYRKTPLTNDLYYHVYNRGVDKRIIFQSNEDVQRFYESIETFNTDAPINSLRDAKKYPLSQNKHQKLVEIVAYCLNPNHFHLILKQNIDNGISDFMKKLSGGYTNYFNKKYNRSGVLFQGKFKSIHISDNSYLLHLSVYVNLNYLVHQYNPDELLMTKSSYDYYKNENNTDSIISDSKIILDQFKNRQEYQNYCEETLPIIIEKKQAEYKDILFD